MKDIQTMIAAEVSELSAIVQSGKSTEHQRLQLACLTDCLNRITSTMRIWKME